MPLLRVGGPQTLPANHRWEAVHSAEHPHVWEEQSHEEGQHRYYREESPSDELPSREGVSVTSTVSFSETGEA